MGVAEFRKLIAEEKAAAATRPPVDWAARRAEWQKAVNVLFADIERYLREFTEAGDVSVERHPVNLHEANLGSYTLEAMNITVFSKTFELVPKGRNVIGANGRVDLRGPLGYVRLVLSAEKDGAWEMIPASRPSPRHKLSKSTFLEALVELSSRDAALA
jgi:hypothetical protein